MFNLIDAGLFLFDKRIFSQFKYERLRLDRELMNLDFLVSCRRWNVVPNFLKNRNKVYILNFPHLNRQFEEKCLKLCIRKKYAYVNSLQKRTYNLYCEFAASTPPHIFDVLMGCLHKYRYNKSHSKEITQRRKLEQLCHSQHKHTNPVSQPVDFLNLSDRILTSDEVRILGRGPKHIFPAKPNLRSIIPVLENIVQSSGSESKEEIRNIMFHELKKLAKQPTKQSSEELNILRGLKLDSEIILIQTDKSNKLAILNTIDYKNKMLECINNMGCLEIKKSPLARINQKVSELVNKGSWPDNMKIIVKCNKFAIIPNIMGRLKDHKTNMPLRPIVTKNCGPTYFIEKAFVILLRNLLPISNHVVRSTEEFIQRLNDTHLPDTFLLASLDIVSLFPSIDTQQVILRINNSIDLMEDINHDMKITLKSALNLIVNNNYFTFDNRIYIQNDGAPMGSPLSGLLAEFVLRPLETDVYNKFDFTPHTWLRYVDDVFIIWQHSNRMLDNFLVQLNSLDPKIKFTLEIEQDGSLPYLDILLIKTTNGIERTVYRKPIANQCSIPYSAQAPISYKLSAFRYFIKRAFTVCTINQLTTELNKIREIAKKNGYSENIIDKLIGSMESKRSNFNIQNSKIFTMQYFPKFFERLKYKLKSFNICLIAKPSIKLKNFVCRKLDPLETDHLSGVYEIPFTKADGRTQYYIGMTNRMFKTRRKEHISDIKNNRLTTALARLNNSETLQIDFQGSRIIYPSRSYLPSVIRESIEIFLRFENVCNESASFVLPGIWREMLSKFKYRE